MSRVTVTKELPAPPPSVATYTLTLGEDEASELAGILGGGANLVNGLYWEILDAIESAGGPRASGEAYKRGLNFSRKKSW